MFEFFRHLLEAEDSKIFFVLALLAGAMIIDFITGVVAAKTSATIEFRSKEGINGILRKVTSMIVLIFLAPVSVLIPGVVGTAFLYTMYLGYLGMEIKSIFENLQKLGSDTTLFEQFIKALTSSDKK